MLNQASRPRSALVLVTPDSFALAYDRNGKRLIDSTTLAAAAVRARAAGLESARAWSTAQPATGRAHLAMVDALLANQQYPDALAEVARFRASDPDNPETPFLQARVRFASGEGPKAAAELKAALAAITAGDFAGAEDAPTVMADVLAGANIFAYYGDLASAARVIELADEIRTEVLPASMPETMRGGDWKRSMQAALYGAAGVPVAALERIWESTVEEARSVPADKRAEVLHSGSDAALGLFAAGDPRPLQEYQAIGGEELPPELTALLALSRHDTVAARKALATPDSARKVYMGWKPLYAPGAVPPRRLRRHHRDPRVLRDTVPRYAGVRLALGDARACPVAPRRRPRTAGPALRGRRAVSAGPGPVEVRRFRHRGHLSPPGGGRTGPGAGPGLSRAAARAGRYIGGGPGSMVAGASAPEESPSSTGQTAR